METKIIEEKSEVEKAFDEYNDIDQPINQGDFGVGFEAGKEHYNKQLFNILSKLVSLKDLKDVFGKNEVYEREQPLAWQEAKRIIKEVEVNGHNHNYFDDGVKSEQAKNYWFEKFEYQNKNI